MPNNKAQLNTGEWVKLYGDYLYNYTVYRINNEEEAQDLVQDTFLSALKNKDQFRGDASEKTWLVTILKRKIIDFYRKKSTQSIQQSIESEKLAAGYNDFFEEEGNHEGHWSNDARPANWIVNPQQVIETREFYQALNKCLDALPEKWCSVFKMKNMEDLETEAICKELNLSSSNYWIIMHRTKLQLRKCIELGWFGIKHTK